MPLKHGSSPSPGSHGIITLLTDNRLESFLQSSVSFAEQTLSGNRSAKSFAPTNFICLGQWNQLPRVFHLQLSPSPTFQHSISISILLKNIYTQHSFSLSLRTTVCCPCIRTTASERLGNELDRLVCRRRHSCHRSTCNTLWQVQQVASRWSARRWKKETLSYLAREVDHQGHRGKKDPLVCLRMGKSGND